MRLSLASRTGFGVLLALTGACNNSPMEVADASETKGDETTRGSGDDEDAEDSTSSADSGSTQTSGSQTNGDTSSATVTSTSSAATSTGTSTSNSEGPDNTTDEEVETSGSTETGQEPNRGCTGEPLPSVKLTEVVTGLANPTGFRFLPSDPGHAYISLRAGTLLRVDLSDPMNGRETILTVETGTSLECGFLSFAFHPDFDGTTEQRLYVSHTPECATTPFGPASSLLAEYNFDGQTATFSRDVVSVEQPANNHNGGLVLFGPDGYLYFGLGDGGGSNDQYGNGQNPATPLATILRYDVDALDTPPPGNLTSDMLGGADVYPYILHWGLRNPWQFSFDRATDDLYIGDVGQDTREEINVLPAGSGPSNFGWPAFEGDGPCPGCQNASLYSGSTDVKPIHTYAHEAGNFAPALSVTGGYVYRGSAIPGLWGRYIYADYQSDWVAALTWDGSSGSCDHGELIDMQRGGFVSFEEDADGELYLVHLNDGLVYRLDPA